MRLTDDQIEHETLLRKNSAVYDVFETEFQAELDQVTEQGMRVLSAVIDECNEVA